MKSARVFVVTVLCALMIGAVAGTATAETGSAEIRTTSSAAPGNDSGWGLIPE
ncbi:MULTISPECIES: hypothetical protein [unclassified Streptomyces]|uniref:hypothetical protein n=1 Tax=unclassified Streptomyces TaxID=2593676 RepID=UPI002DDB7A3A|nr:hypothetical protein [Streptomyces sp. NBC_01237]WRZ77338.1 hypothetical protein OG251_37495 [Streptomyces sp. NBC_01237]